MKISKVVGVAAAVPARAVRLGSYIALRPSGAAIALVAGGVDLIAVVLEGAAKGVGAVARVTAKVGTGAINLDNRIGATMTAMGDRVATKVETKIDTMIDARSARRQAKQAEAPIVEQKPPDEEIILPGSDAVGQAV